jgi:tetratricopeptide (TPR) repeat protein
MSMMKSSDNKASICCKDGVGAIYKGEYNLAIGAFKQAIDLNPEIALAHAGLCLAYHELGRSEEMCDSFERLSAMDSVDAERLFSLAIVFYEGGDYQAACRSVRQSMSVPPDEALTHYVYGRVLLEIGSYEQGTSSLKRALELVPTFQAVQDLLSWVPSYLSLDDDKRRLRVIQRRRRLHQTPFDLDQLELPQKITKLIFPLRSEMDRAGRC